MIYKYQHHHYLSFALLPLICFRGHLEVVNQLSPTNNFPFIWLSRFQWANGSQFGSYSIPVICDRFRQIPPRTFLFSLEGGFFQPFLTQDFFPVSRPSSLSPPSCGTFTKPFFFSLDTAARVIFFFFCYVYQTLRTFFFFVEWESMSVQVYPFLWRFPWMRVVSSIAVLKASVLPFT